LFITFMSEGARNVSAFMGSRGCNARTMYVEMLAAEHLDVALRGVLQLRSDQREEREAEDRRARRLREAFDDHVCSLQGLTVSRRLPGAIRRVERGPEIGSRRRQRGEEHRLHHALDESERPPLGPHREVEGGPEPQQPEDQDEEHGDHAAVTNQRPHAVMNAVPEPL
jgi:hypothetical protein